MIPNTKQAQTFSKKILFQSFVEKRWKVNYSYFLSIESESLFVIFYVNFDAFLTICNNYLFLLQSYQNMIQELNKRTEIKVEMENI